METNPPQVEMLFVLVFASYLTSNFLPATATSLLRCNQPHFTCPDSLVSCECQGVASLEWTITSMTTGSELFHKNYLGNDAIGSASSTNGFTTVLCNVTLDPPIQGLRFTRLSSKLNYSLATNVNVHCRDNTRSDSVSLYRAGELATCEAWSIQ